MILAISIVVEVIGDAMLTASHGYDHALLGIAAIIAIVFSFFLFSKILHIIDLPIAYATWCGVGTVATALIGVLYYKEKMSLTNIAGLLIMTIGIVMLNYC